MSNENNIQKINAADRHGKIIFIISAACIPLWILLSKGYLVQANLFANILYVLHVDFFTICSDRESEKCSPLLSFSTSNLILLSIVTGTYGILVWQKLVPSPVLLTRSIISGIREKNSSEEKIKTSISTENIEHEEKIKTPISTENIEHIENIKKENEQFTVVIISVMLAGAGFAMIWTLLGYLGTP